MENIKTREQLELEKKALEESHAKIEAEIFEKETQINNLTSIYQVGDVVKDICYSERIGLILSTDRKDAYGIRWISKDYIEDTNTAKWEHSDKKTPAKHLQRTKITQAQFEEVYTKAKRSFELIRQYEAKLKWNKEKLADHFDRLKALNE